MGLLKKKDILLASDFAHAGDPFYADNQVLKTTSKNELPGDASSVLVAKGQAVFYTVDNILNKLLANDKFISQYLEKIKATGISKERAQKAFQQNVTSLDIDYYESQYIDHIDTHHNPADKTYVQLSSVYGSYMHDDFSNIDIEGAREHFIKQRYDNPTTYRMSSDVLISCEFDDSPNVNYPTNYVNVQIMNQHTGGVFSYSLSKGDSSEIASQVPSTTNSKYIYKEWLSGMKELLIYIPTTFTFYNGRLGMDGSDPHSQASYIRIIINKRHFKLRHIYNMQICGQSLPLQISASSDPEFPYFNDCPQPSLVRTMPISDQLSANTNCIYDENTNMFTLYFCCCGTDAQAIQIFGD